MRSAAPRLLAAALTAVVLTAGAPARLVAHHEILAKFDDGKRMTLKGVVTLIDWRNPHVHVFINVPRGAGQPANWAIELESPIDLQKGGWNRATLQPGDASASRDGPHGMAAVRSGVTPSSSARRAAAC
jgi:hypothetical protein